jgi:hypothetical protein
MQNSQDEVFGLVEDIFADLPPPTPPHRSRRKNGVDFVFLRGVSSLNAYILQKRAAEAFPLLLALQQQFDASRKTQVPITHDVWKTAGDPSKNKRETMMEHLRRLPGLVTLHEDRCARFRYRVEKGTLWLQIEEASREGIGPEKED